MVEVRSTVAAAASSEERPVDSRLFDSRLFDLLWEFQDDVLGWVVAHVGDGSPVAAGKPFGVSGFEVAGLGTLPFATVEDFEIADGNEQLRADVGMGYHASGLEFEFGDTNAVPNEEDFLGAAVKNVEAPGFVPRRWRVAKFVVLEKFEGDHAKGLGPHVADNVGNGSGNETGLAVG